MKVELTHDAAQWVEAEIAAGTFPTPEDAAPRAIRQAKLAALRGRLDASVAEGGSHSANEVRRQARMHLDRLNQTAKPTQLARLVILTSALRDPADIAASGEPPRLAAGAVMRPAIPSAYEPSGEAPYQAAYIPRSPQ